MAAILAAITTVSTRAEDAAGPKPQPPKYVWAQAYHVLPATHSDESGYLSMCEGLNNRIYIGTAKYGQNSYLVEFDPPTANQRIVIDTHKVCGLTATGYAAQAKIHTRNFVGRSGKIYVGSKQGYRRGPDDTAEYPGGYLLTYNPTTRKTECLGMPYPGQGVIDVVADEDRGRLYVVTCEDQHWMLFDVQCKRCRRELGPILAPYMTTLIDDRQRATVITKDFQLVQYDPKTEGLTTREIFVDGRKLTAEDLKSGPINWVASADGQTAYLLRMSESTLFAIDLAGDDPLVRAVNLGRMIDGKGFDSRGSLCVAPDGRVYALIRVDNQTGFGTGYLHHLVRYDPKLKKMEDLGVLAVKNPDFFDFGPGPDGKPKPWTHGYHKLPDGTLTPLHGHQAMIVAKDGSLYATILYPFTLLHILPPK